MGRGQFGLMGLLSIMPLVQDHSLDLLTSSPAQYHGRPHTYMPQNHRQLIQKQYLIILLMCEFNFCWSSHSPMVVHKYCRSTDYIVGHTLGVWFIFKFVSLSPGCPITGQLYTAESLPKVPFISFNFIYSRYMQL